MKLSIYNTTIKVESQEQADRLKKACIDNGLPIWNHILAFAVNRVYINSFMFRNNCFLIAEYIKHEHLQRRTQITESEWMELLKEK